MFNQKICNYHSNKNCFVYIDSKLRNVTLNEKTVIEILYDKDKKAFFSILFKESPRNYLSREDEEKFYLNSFYAKNLKINEGDTVLFKNFHQNCPIATSITIEPSSQEDWEILELNLDSVQDNLLYQINVVFKNQTFPVWVESDTCIFVKTIAFEPNVGDFTCINNMTRVIIQPTVTPESNQMSKINESVSHAPLVFSAQAMFDDEPFSFCNKLTKCSNLTSIELVNEPNDNSANSYKYIASIETLKSPIQALKVKDSSTTSIRKFLQSIENSYPQDYNDIGSSYKIYAFLKIDEDNLNKVLNGSVDYVKPRLKMSSFLRRQLKLFDQNPKVLIRASSILDSNNEILLSNTSNKEIKLRTSYSKNVQHVKQGFVKFIDQHTECLCPLILTNGMLIEFEYENEKITCVVQVKTDFIAISSNLLLHNLLKINVEVTNEVDSLRLMNLESLNHVEFPLKVFNCSWFESNLNEIMAHLNNNLFNKNLNKYSRNMVLQGLKGSGKSILCKHICNMISRPPYNAVYHYINCQNFMSKTAETIHDQLNLIVQECVWYENAPCLIVLENLDLLIENKSHSIDPSSMLYHAQIVESISDLLKKLWDNKNSRTVAIVTISCPFSEMPSEFHCLDEHGLFSEFIQVKSHSIKEETKEIIELILQNRNAKFNDDLIEHIISQTDGFVFKDIEKLVDKLVFNNWKSIDSEDIGLKQSQEVLYNYTCMNMSETKFYKAKSELNWNMIGGLEDVKQSLTESLIWPIKYKELFRRLSMKQSGGVLLYGPSGCGKTIIASALANESKFNFISVKGPELLSKYIGNSEQNVRDLFTKAQKARPCIIFFDEFDSLAPKRGHDSTGVTDRVVNQLLTQLDGVEQLDGVYLLAATSRPDLIDQALLRPGRLDSFLYVGYPNEKEVKKIISLYSSDTNLDPDMDLDEISKMCKDFSGADLKSIVCDALVKAFHRAHDSLANEKGLDLKIGSSQQTEISQDMLQSRIKISMQDMTTSVETIKKTINMTERMKMKTLYENWKEKKTMNDPQKQKKARVTLA